MCKFVPKVNDSHVSMNAMSMINVKKFRLFSLVSHLLIQSLHKKFMFAFSVQKA